MANGSSMRNLLESSKAGESVYCFPSSSPGRSEHIATKRPGMFSLPMLLGRLLHFCLADSLLTGEEHYRFIHKGDPMRWKPNGFAIAPPYAH